MPETPPEPHTDDMNGANAKFRIPRTTAERVFGNSLQQDVHIKQFDWKWGDNSSDKAIELICKLVKSGKTPVVEFGTFRGKTTYNIALNSDDDVYTIDIGHQAGRDIDASSNIRQHKYDEHETGELFRASDADFTSRIHQLIGDSTQMDLSHLYGTVGLVYVDGGHSYEVCKADSELALKLIKDGGVIVWDDYGKFWPGVKRALDELSTEVSLFHLPDIGTVVHVSGLEKSDLIAD